jgi:hypothetical protein
MTDKSNKDIEKLSVDPELYEVAKRCSSNITSCSASDGHSGGCGGNGHVCGGAARNTGSCSTSVVCRPANHTHCSIRVGGCSIYVGDTCIITNVHCAVPI